MSRHAVSIGVVMGFITFQWEAIAQKEVAPPPRRVRLLARLGSSELMHPNYVIHVAYSNDGKLFASGTASDVGIWEWPSGQLVHQFKHDTRDFGALLRFSPDGKYLAGWANRAGGSTFMVWNLISGECLLSQKFGLHATLDSYSISDTRAILRSSPKSIDVFDLANKRWLEPIATKEPVLSLGSDGAGQFLIAEGSGKVVRVYSSEPGKVNRRILLEAEPTQVHFGPRAEWVAIFSGSRMLTAVALSDGKELFKPQTLPNNFELLAFAPKGGRAFVRPHPRETLLWDFESGERVYEIERPGGGRSGLYSAAFAPDGKSFAGGLTTDGPFAATFWDAATGKPIEMFPGHRSEITDIHFLPGDKEIATVAGSRSDPTVRIWDANTGKQIRVASVHPGGAWCVESTADGSRLVTLGSRYVQPIKVLETKSLVTLKTINAFPSNEPGISLWPDGSRIAISRNGGQKEHNFGVVDLRSGKLLEMFATHTEAPGKDPFLADRLQTALSSKFNGYGRRPSRDGRLTAWVDREHLKEPDSKKRTYIVDESITGKRLASFEAPSDAFGIAFRPDNRVVAFGDGSGTIRLFDLANRFEVLTLPTGSHAVMRLEFSRDGRKLAVVTVEETSNVVNIWDVADVVPDMTDGKADPISLKHWSQALTDPGPSVAFSAAWKLIAAKELAPAAMKAERESWKPVEAKKIDALINDLGDEDFKTRENASQELAAIGEQVLAPAAQVLKTTPSPERRRRLETLLRYLNANGPGREALFASRAVFVMEQLGSDAAVNQLLEWAKLSTGRLANEAKVALARMGRAYQN